MTPLRLPLPSPHRIQVKKKSFTAPLLPDERVRLGQDGRRAGTAEGSTNRPARRTDLILFNTCSVRERRREKVFHDPGRVKDLKKLNRRGDRASAAAWRRGGRRHCRAGAFVDVVFGPQTLHRLPQMIAKSGSDRPFAGGHFLPRNLKFDQHAARARGGASAFVSIMEGCSKYCTFCVVPPRAVRKYRARSGRTDRSCRTGDQGRRRSRCSGRT